MDSWLFGSTFTILAMNEKFTCDTIVALHDTKRTKQLYIALSQRHVHYHRDKCDHIKYGYLRGTDMRVTFTDHEGKFNAILH